MAVLVSPQAANEELHLVRRVFEERLPGSRFFYSAFSPAEPTADDFLRKADKHPNTRGAELMGFGHEGDERELLRALNEGRIDSLYVMHHDLTRLPGGAPEDWEKALRKLSLLIYHGTNHNRTAAAAQLVLPVAAFAERVGTVTNFAGRVQRQNLAFSPAGEALPGWQLLVRLGNALGGEYPFRGPEEVFADLARRQPAFAGLDYGRIGSGGSAVPGAEGQPS